MVSVFGSATINLFFELVFALTANYKSIRILPGFLKPAAAAASPC